MFPLSRKRAFRLRVSRLALDYYYWFQSGLVVVLTVFHARFELFLAFREYLLDAGARTFLVLYWVPSEPSEPVLLLNIRIGGQNRFRWTEVTGSFTIAE